jgi:tRNA modification GTPase
LKVCLGDTGATACAPLADDTIAAVATAIAPGEGSVAIVRLSGPEAEAIGRRVFSAPGAQAWDSHRVLYGHVCDPVSGERIDEALLLLMLHPRNGGGAALPRRTDLCAAGA